MQLPSSLTSNALLSAGAAAAATGCALLLGASLYRRWRFWSAWTRIDELQVLRDNRVGRPVIVVTGAGGFLGRSVVSEALRRAPEMDVVAVDIAFSDAVLSDGGLSGVTFIKADVRSAEQCERALRGAVCVIHTAGLVPGAGVRMPECLWQVNVEGTQNILEASMKLGVASLVYTSSASVVVPAGTRKLEMEEVTAGEAATDKPFDAYALSKSMAERLVLDCCSNSMPTVVMRPGGMFGQGDRFLVDICSKGKATTVGRGDNFIPYIWVADVAAAHVQAATTLLKRGEAAKQLAGKALFLTNDHATDRITYYELYGGSPLAAAPGDSAPAEGLWPLGPPDRIPFWLAYSLASVNDFLQGCFDLRLLPSAMTTSQMLWSQVSWGFSTAATRQLLPGWKPTPVREALAKLAGQAASP